MAKYSNGKIYKIEAINATEGDSDIYIGSTTKESLLSRFESHRHDYDGWKLKCKNYGKMMSFDVFDKYDIDNCHIVLLESYPCDSKYDLHEREAYWIRTLANVNKNIPNRTRKMYREEHKTQISEMRKKMVVCCCGTEISNHCLSRHLKSKKHADLVLASPSSSTASI
jgi:hypothetical protein